MKMFGVEAITGYIDKLCGVEGGTGLLGSAWNFVLY